VAGIIQLSAFPYIKLNKVKKWKWKLEASYENYQNIKLRPTYKKLDDYKYKGRFKGLICTPIIAETESELGLTNSKFLYNKDYGFVFLEFNNIDNSKIILELVEL